MANKRCLGFLALMLCCLAPPRADAGIYAAYTEGAAVSQPFVQGMGGILVNWYDPATCGFSNSVLQERTTASYTSVPGAPLGTITRTVAMLSSGTVGLSQFLPGLPLQPTYQQVTTIGVTDVVTGPPTIVLGPFSAEQRERDDPILPLIGPDHGLVAQTHGDLATLDVGPIFSPPLPVVLFNALAAGPTDGVGMFPLFGEQLIAIRFTHEYSRNGGANQLLGFLDFFMDETGNGIVVSDFDQAVLQIIPDPLGFNFSLTASSTRSIPFNPGDTIVFTNSVGAQLHTEFFGCIPEPSSLTLLSLGSVTLLGYVWRRRRVVVSA